MTTLREAAQQALEALEETQRHRAYTQGIPDAITSLRAALAQQEQEPVAKMHVVFEDNNGALRRTPEDCQAFGANGQPAAVYVGRQRYVPEQERADPAQAPCNRAEDGVCEVIDCCRKSPLILEALEIGYDSTQAEAAQYHAAMAGYRPEQHAAMDADVQKIAKAITAVKAALAQEEQEPVVYTGDVARTMLESGMTFHLGMPHAIVMKQMTRFYDLVCAEASLRAAAAFAIPTRREWQGLTSEEREQATGWSVEHIEAALKEKNA